MACPNEGCPARVPRGSLIEHRQRSQHGAQQRCSVAVGPPRAPPGVPTSRLPNLRAGRAAAHEQGAPHHQPLSPAAGAAGDFLEEDDALLMGSSQQEAQTIPEGSTGAELWRARGQDTL